MVEVVIPYGGECPYRERALEHVRPRYEALWPTRIASMGGHDFTKSMAINEAARESEADVLVLADADCWTDGIEAAVEVALDGEPWAIPHRKVHRLTEKATEAVLSGAEPTGQPTVERPYVGVKAGGVVVVRHEVLLDVPWDERFKGWGRQDLSWRAAMTTLYGAKPWRGDAPLFHLWHPPAPRRTRTQSLSKASEALYARYKAARFDERAIRELLKGARCAPSR